MVVSVSLTVIGVVVYLLFRRSRDKGLEAFLQGVLTVATMFLGVFLAAAISLYQQERSTRNLIKTLLRTAHLELDSSRKAIQSPGETITESFAANWIRVQDNPGKSLEVLLSSVAFIERGEPEIVVDLMNLSKGFPWINRSHGGATVYGEERGGKEEILARIELAIRLLEIQQEVFAAKLSSNAAKRELNKARASFTQKWRQQRKIP